MNQGQQSQHSVKQVQPQQSQQTPVKQNHQQKPQNLLNTASDPAQQIKQPTPQQTLAQQLQRVQGQQSPKQTQQYSSNNQTQSQLQSQQHIQPSSSPQQQARVQQTQQTPRKQTPQPRSSQPQIQQSNKQTVSSPSSPANQTRQQIPQQQQNSKQQIGESKIKEQDFVQIQQTHKMELTRLNEKLANMQTEAQAKIESLSNDIITLRNQKGLLEKEKEEITSQLQKMQQRIKAYTDAVSSEKTTVQGAEIRYGQQLKIKEKEIEDAKKIQLINKGLEQSNDKLQTQLKNLHQVVQDKQNELEKTK